MIDIVLVNDDKVIYDESNLILPRGEGRLYYGEFGFIEPSKVPENTLPNLISNLSKLNNNDVDMGIFEELTIKMARYYIFISNEEIMNKIKASYTWEIYDELLQDYLPYGTDAFEEIYEGNINIDKILLNYISVKPSTLTKVRLSKNKKL